MKAIETEYNGYRFRSRLEARWAVFFDTLGIKYEYEPEGFDLDGVYYLPDFWLPDIKTWVEVKGVMRKEDSEKINKFIDKILEENGNYWKKPEERLMVVGNIPSESDTKHLYDWMFETKDGMYSCNRDWPYLPCVCPICGKFGFEYEGRGGRICRHSDDDHVLTGKDPRILKAYLAANEARFEHRKTRVDNATNAIDHGATLAQKFLLGLVNVPGVAGLIMEYISTEDFTEPFYGKVAAMAFEQARQGEVNASRLLDHFVDSEERTRADALINASVVLKGTAQMGNAFADAILKVKRSSMDKIKEEDIMEFYQQMKELQQLQSQKGTIVRKFIELFENKKTI